MAWRPGRARGELRDSTVRYSVENRNHVSHHSRLSRSLRSPFCSLSDRFHPERDGLLPRQVRVRPSGTYIFSMVSTALPRPLRLLSTGASCNACVVYVLRQRVPSFATSHVERRRPRPQAPSESGTPVASCCCGPITSQMLARATRQIRFSGISLNDVHEAIWDPRKHVPHEEGIVTNSVSCQRDRVTNGVNCEHTETEQAISEHVEAQYGHASGLEAHAS